MRRVLVSQRLPQFDAVAVAVLDPGEAAVAGVLALGIDPDSGSSKLGEQSVEVVDAVVNHGRLCAVAEVAGVGGEGRPSGHAGAGGDFVGPQKGGAAEVVQRQAEVVGVPLCQRLWILRAEEDAADACDSCHGTLQWLAVRARKKKKPCLMSGRSFLQKEAYHKGNRFAKPKVHKR